MSLIVKESSGGTDFAPIPTGMHHSAAYGVIDIGTQPSTGNFPARRKVMFLWEIPGERISIEKNGVKTDMPRAISQRYTLSLNSKGNLRPMLESWRGRPFTEAELEGFDLKSVLGANCFLNVVHAKGKGDKASRVYANVASVNPITKTMPKLKPENPLIMFSLDDSSGPVQIPEAIPDWIKALIVQSEEYKARLGDRPLADGSETDSHVVDEDGEEPPPF